MAERHLIDTSGVIKYLNEIFPSSGLSFMDEVVDHESILSFITEIELLVWDPPNPDDIKIYQLFQVPRLLVSTMRSFKTQSTFANLII